MTRMKPVERHAAVTGRRVWLARRSNGARLHAGIDLSAPRGGPVVAPEDGRVELVLEDADATPGWKGYGPGVVLIHGASGAWHNLAHVIPAPGLSAGDVVQAGARVASQSSLAHVHWEVRAVKQPTAGRAVVEDCADPLAWVEGRIERWDGRCPETPGNDYRTPRACRPSWRGPRPAPLVPWPGESEPGSPPRS